MESKRYKTNDEVCVTTEASSCSYYYMYTGRVIAVRSDGLYVVMFQDNRKLLFTHNELRKKTNESIK